MKLRSTKLLADYMEAGDFSQARLARYVDCSRQFISMLAKGERQTCTPHVATRIEEALRVLPGTLFVESMSTARTQPASTVDALQAAS
jgi:transcriptional regulator with XRE-family HTH domain